MIEREAIHVPDMSTPEAQAEFPDIYATVETLGVRTSWLPHYFARAMQLGPS